MAPMAPNLTDKDWMYGSTLEDIKYGINNGRAAQMPAHLPLIGETQVRLAAAYVYSLSQTKK
jgi:cytochrome c oxidase cbb3-type subunit III